MEYNFKGGEHTRTLNQLVDIYESQLISSKDTEYINALIALIKEKYNDQGLSDYNAEPDGDYENIDIELVYHRFEEKVVKMIAAYDSGEVWKPSRNIKVYKN